MTTPRSNARLTYHRRGSWIGLSAALFYASIPSGRAGAWPVAAPGPESRLSVEDRALSALEFDSLLMRGGRPLLGDVRVGHDARGMLTNACVAQRCIPLQGVSASARSRAER